MNGETAPSPQPSEEFIKKVPVSELLRRAGEAFDEFHNEYKNTHNYRILIAKMRLLNELPDECEKYGEDWNEYKDKILAELHGLNKQMTSLMSEGRFSTCSDRVGYGQTSEDREVNVCYRLAEACSKKDLPEDKITTASSNE